MLIVRVHPEILAAQHIPGAKPNDKFWTQRYDDINCFERHLVQNGTVILKFFLNVSKEAQRQRFLERIRDPNKHWKFSDSDLGERAHWDDYMKAYEDAIEATTTEWAPWYVVPADHKWVSRAIVAKVVTTTIQSLDLKYPEVSAKKREQIAAAEKQLESEEE